MSEVDTIIVAQDGVELERAFKTWDEARLWNDKVASNRYTLTEVLLEELPEAIDD